MPATSLAALKNITELVERALTEQLKAFGGDTIVPLSFDDVRDIRITPLFQLGPASGHRYLRPDGQWDYDLFADCVVSFDIIVPRLLKKDESYSQATYDAVYTALRQETTRILLALDPAQWPVLNGRLDWHHLTKLRPTGVQHGFDPASGTDRAEVRFACWCGIKPDAWPTDPRAYGPVAS